MSPFDVLFDIIGTIAHLLPEIAQFLQFVSLIMARVILSQVSLNSSDRQSLADRSFNNTVTVCWSAGA